MGASLNGSAVRTEAKSSHEQLDELRAKGSMVRSAVKNAQNSAQFETGRSVVREAMRRADNYPQKNFGVDADQKSESVVSEWFSGGRNLPFDAIYRQQDPLFRMHFLQTLRDAWGMNAEFEHEIEEAELTAMFVRLLRRRTA